MATLLRDELAQAQLLRAMGYAAYGGADIGECLAVADRIERLGLDSWYEQWSAMAARLSADARHSESAGDRASARSAYLRAANYFRTAGLFLLSAPIDHRLVSARAAEVDAFRRGAALLDCPPELLGVPFDQGALECYFFRPADDGRARPTLILTTGYDGSAEELYFANAVAALERGYNVLAFEGPGQGSMLIDDRLPIRADWENVVTPVVDALIERADVDPRRIAIMGLSLGGYLAPRAASAEHRLAACISDCGPYDVYTVATGRLPGFLRPAIDQPGGLRVRLLRRALASVAKMPSAGWALRRNLLVHGLTDPLEYFREARKFSLRGREKDIRCPTFVGTAEHDDLSAAAPEFYAALTCPKTLVRFIADDGAGEHCEGAGRLVFHRAVFDWLAGVMEPGAGGRS